MRTVRVQAHAATDPDRAYDAIVGLGGELRVPFRGRAIRWAQRYEPGPDRRTIAFTQIDGDFRTLTGVWRIAPVAGGCEVCFEATFDVGVPIYDRILDLPVAAVLADRARAVIARL